MQDYLRIVALGIFFAFYAPVIAPAQQQASDLEPLFDLSEMEFTIVAAEVLPKLFIGLMKDIQIKVDPGYKIVAVTLQGKLRRAARYTIHTSDFGIIYEDAEEHTRFISNRAKAIMFGEGATASWEMGTFTMNVPKPSTQRIRIAVIVPEKVETFMVRYSALAKGKATLREQQAAPQAAVRQPTSQETSRATPTGPIHVEADMTPPKKTFAPQPPYTEEARNARLQGVVIVQAIIDSNGDVTSVKLMKGLPMGLDQSALETIKTWKFKPAALADGRPVAVYYNLTANSRLE